MALTVTNPSAQLHGDYRDFGKGGRYGPTGENAPTKTTDENGNTQFDYWETDQNKINAFLKSNANDPAYRQAMSRGEAGIDTYLHDRGYAIVPTKAKYDVESGEVKDKSWWDKNKHWAIPSMVLGGAIAAPALAGAFAGGGGATLPSTVAGQSMSTLPAAGGGLGGVTAAGTSAVLPATTVSALGSLPATGASNMGLFGKAGSWLLKAGKGYLKDQLTNPDLLSSTLGGYSNAAANNRGTEADLRLVAQGALEQQMLAREQEKRDAQDHAYRNAMLGERAATWKPLVRPDHISGSYQGSTLNSQALGNLVYGQGKTRLEQPDLMKPTGLDPYQQDPDILKQAKPGIMERVTGWGSAVAPLLRKR